MEQKMSLRKDTATYTLKDIKEEVKEDVELLAALGYKEALLNFYSCESNARAVRRLGRCTKVAPQQYIITINSNYLKMAKPESVHNTIMHEVIHSLPGCMNHGAKWQNIARRVSAQYEFGSITRTHDLGTDPEYNKYLASKYRYTIECTQCHSKWNFMRRTKTFDACNHGRATCSCGGKKFICTEL